MENPRNLTSFTEEDVKYFIENYFEPVIFNGFLSDWNILSWSLKDWGDKLGTQSLQFRKNYFLYSEEPHWERTCETIKMTMSDFNNFQSKDQKSWLYFDYKYMSEWFATQEDLLNDISWKQFGYPGKTGKDSTIWIGSKGAHTPCHMDTYGCNLIAQVYGRKQWILFPPEEDLKPTRVPYEESSVYSKFNFFTPNINKIAALNTAKVVVLNPGDVLFLPPKWWHFVENLDTAISVNIWLPLPEDNRMRVEEAVTQMVISEFIKDLPVEEQNLVINSNQDEVLETTITNSLVLLEKVIELYKNENITHKETETITKLQIIYDKLSENGNIQKIKKCSKLEFENLLKSKETNYPANSKLKGEKSKKIEILEKVINSICHPTVLSNITNRILDE